MNDETEHDTIQQVDEDRPLGGENPFIVTHLADGTPLPHPVDVSRFSGPPLQPDTDEPPTTPRRRRSPRKRDR